MMDLTYDDRIFLICCIWEAVNEGFYSCPDSLNDYGEEEIKNLIEKLDPDHAEVIIKEFTSRHLL